MLVQMLSQHRCSSGLVELASRFGSWNIPTPPTVKVVYLQIARYELILKPAAAIAASVSPNLAKAWSPGLVSSLPGQECFSSEGCEDVQ